MNGKLQSGAAGRKTDLQMRADFLMLVVTMLWGSSYLFMKMGLDTIQEFNLVALRFGIAFLLAGAVFYKRLMHIHAKVVFQGFILGTLLFTLMAAVTIGLKYTTISNTGFLFSLSVVFVPLLLAVFFKVKTEMRVLFGIGIAIIGIALMTLTSGLAVNIGDALIIFGALVYALMIIVTDKLTKGSDPIALGILQLGFAGALGLVCTFLFETPQLPQTKESWIAVMALSVLCSAIGFIGQAFAQKYTTPTRTGLIFSLEPVFAALFAFIFVHETLNMNGYIGGALILAGVLAATIKWKSPVFIRSKMGETESMLQKLD